ncbi:MAG: S1/P1 nuclease [Pseudomonadales bacterium]
MTLMRLIRAALLMNLQILIFVFGLIASSQTYAWGSTGHRLVCQLAYDRLSVTAKTFVAETLALGVELDGNGDNDFAEACLWPDAARHKDYQGTYEWHFINVPAAARGIEFARDCAAMDCIAVGIQRNLTYLARPTSGKREQARKAAALRFLGHFIGDLHQPLHVSHAEDWGGNKIRVTWFDEEVNLHAVWDTKIIERAGLTYPDSIEFLGSVEGQFKSRNVLAWMRESFRLARSHAYANINGAPIQSGDELDRAYFERSKPVVIEQLATAARRLAYLIEGIADGTLDTNILIE